MQRRITLLAAIVFAAFSAGCGGETGGLPPGVGGTYQGSYSRSYGGVNLFFNNESLDVGVSIADDSGDAYNIDLVANADGSFEGSNLFGTLSVSGVPYRDATGPKYTLVFSGAINLTTTVSHVSEDPYLPYAGTYAVHLQGSVVKNATLHIAASGEVSGEGGGEDPRLELLGSVNPGGSFSSDGNLYQGGLMIQTFVSGIFFRNESGNLVFVGSWQNGLAYHGKVTGERISD